jgi:hypothetical protein
MLAASIDQQIIFAIAAAVYGIFVWWNDRRKKKEEEELQKRLAEQRRLAKESGQAETPQPAGQAAESSEQDKLRKFLEALGVPSGQAPPPQPPRPVHPLPPPVIPPPRTPAPPPRPVIVAPPPLPRPVRSPVRPVQVPAPRPVYVSLEPAPSESRDPGHLETASEEMMRAARHDQTVVPHTVATPAAMIARPVPVAVAALKEALRTKENLRAAFLVREILGPPPGLW